MAANIDIPISAAHTRRMRKQLPVFFSCAACLLCCAGLSASPRAESPQRKALLYTDGITVIEQQIESRDLVNGGIALPAALDPDTVMVSQNGSRLNRFSLEHEPAAAAESSGSSDEKLGYFITFPGFDWANSLTLRYAIKGIKWFPRMEAVIEDEKTLQLHLSAVIQPEGNGLSGCSITLVNADSQNKPLTVADTYELGPMDLHPLRTEFCHLDVKPVSYARYYRWDASSEDGAESILAFTSPFRSVMYDCHLTVTMNNAVMNQGVIDALWPQTTVEVQYGEETLIQTSRSIVTKEDMRKDPIPFNHAVTLNVRNGTGSPIDIRLFFSKKSGMYHKTEYHFPIPPDDRPGEWLVWNLKLPKDGEKTISFDFDTDVKDFSEYLNYGYYEGGR
jgi:hypothetical protein